MKRARGTAPPSTFNKDLLINLALGVGFPDAISLAPLRNPRKILAVLPRALEESKGRFLEESSFAWLWLCLAVLCFALLGFGCALLCLALLYFALL